MDLRMLAESDLAFTLESKDSDIQEFVFTDPTGHNYSVTGHLNDIGFGYDSLGNQVATRSICIMWRLSRMMQDGHYVEPSNGWKVSWLNLIHQLEYGFVTRYEPDRTLGIGRVYLSLDFANGSFN